MGFRSGPVAKRKLTLAVGVSAFTSALVCRSHLDGGVGVGDDRDKKAEDHVDEERHKGVEIDPAENPNEAALLVHVLKGGKHVIPVDQGEQALRHRVQRPELPAKKRTELKSPNSSFPPPFLLV